MTTPRTDIGSCSGRPIENLQMLETMLGEAASHFNENEYAQAEKIVSLGH